MGTTASKTQVKVLQEQINDVVSRSVSVCATSVNQNQNVKIVNNGFRLWGNYNITQTTAIDSQCVQNTKFEAELQNKIIETISQASTSTGVAILSAFGNSDSQALADLTARVQNSIKVENIMQHYNSVSQNQTVEEVNNFIWLFQSLDAVQGSEIFAASTLQAISDAGIFNTIESHLDQSAKAEQTNPLDFITDIVTSTQQTLMVMVIAVVIVVAIVAVILMKTASTVLTDPEAMNNIGNLADKAMAAKTK